MESERMKKSSFLEENFKGVSDLATMSQQSQGKNLSQTVSDSAAGRTARETSNILQASWGVVRDKIVETQSSGRVLIFEQAISMQK